MTSVTLMTRFSTSKIYRKTEFSFVKLMRTIALEMISLNSWIKSSRTSSQFEQRKFQWKMICLILLVSNRQVWRPHNLKTEIREEELTCLAPDWKKANDPDFKRTSQATGPRISCQSERTLTSISWLKWWEWSTLRTIQFYLQSGKKQG